MRKVHIRFIQSLKCMTLVKSFRLVVLVAILLVVSLVALESAVSSPASASTAGWTERGRIMIDSDSKFTVTNGVVSGSGSKSDPYIIEGWKIGPSANVTAIDIYNTNAYFRIRNVYVFSCSIGVLMSHVHNGRVENSQFIDDSVGVAVVESDDCKIVNNTFEGNDVAISISHSDVSLSDNTYINNGVKVARFKNEQPWEFTQVGAVVCVAVLIPLVAIISLLVYYRFKRVPPPVQ